MQKRISTEGIAEMLGYTRKHVTDNIIKRPDFPKPAIAISQRNRQWNESDVIAWINKVSQAA